MTSAEWVVLGVFAAAVVFLSVKCALTLTVPDKVTLPGIGAGLLVSWLLPGLHQVNGHGEGLLASLAGSAAGFGSVYLMLRLGKVLFGRQRVLLEKGSKVVFTEKEIVLPDRKIAYEEVFYRGSDEVQMSASHVYIEVADPGHVNCGRGFENVVVRLSPSKLVIGTEVIDPDTVPRLEVVTDAITFPREAIGLGVAKFMGFAGAFLGWKGVCFALLAGMGGGILAGVLLVLRKDPGSKLDAVTPLSAAALVWVVFRSATVLSGCLAVVLGGCFVVAFASLGRRQRE